MIGILINLERDRSHCYLRVLDAKLTVRDEGRSSKESVFESNEQAIAACQKFVNRRLKIGWKIDGQSDSDIFLKSFIRLESALEDARKEKGFGKIESYILKHYPGGFSDIQKLGECIDLQKFDVPQDYKEFIFMMRGFNLSQKVSKGEWVSYVSLEFITPHRQSWFQENKEKMVCLEHTDQPFIVVSEFHDSSFEEFSGAILFLTEGKVRKFDRGDVIGSFESFQDYFLFESKEMIQYLFNGLAWVKRKAG